MRISSEAGFLTYCCRERESTDWSVVEQRARAVQDWHRAAALCVKRPIAPLLLPLEELGRRNIISKWSEATLGALQCLTSPSRPALRTALREILMVIRERGAEVIGLRG